MLNTVRFILNHPLNKGHMWSALSRYIRWQLGSRILRHPIIVPFTDHARLMVSTSMCGATGNIYCGLHEFEDMAFVLHFLRPGDLFVDVGANVGSYTVLAAKVCGARVVAVEPVPETFLRLLDNIAVNHIQDSTTAVQAGLGREPDTLRFTQGFDTMNHVVPAGETEIADTIECPVTRLDDLMAGQTPTFIKIDVEGFESEVVGGGTKSLSNERLMGVLMETNSACIRYGKGNNELHAMMHDFGFRTYHYYPFERRLEATSKADTMNTLFLRNITFVTDRVVSAKPVLIFRRAL